MTKMVSYDGSSALHWAARNGHADCIRTLLSIDSSMSYMVDNDGSSSLHEAALNGHNVCIRTLLSVDPSLTKMVDKKKKLRIAPGSKERTRRLHSYVTEC
eukprot:PhF_6_TR13003/c5_g1_i1/m.20596